MCDENVTSPGASPSDSKSFSTLVVCCGIIPCEWLKGKCNGHDAWRNKGRVILAGEGKKTVATLVVAPHEPQAAVLVPEAISENAANALTGLVTRRTVSDFLFASL